MEETHWRSNKAGWLTVGQSKKGKLLLVSASIGGMVKEMMEEEAEDGYLVHGKSCTRSYVLHLSTMMDILSVLN